jgi:hypothetical protein
MAKLQINEYYKTDLELKNSLPPAFSTSHAFSHSPCSQLVLPELVASMTPISPSSLREVASEANETWRWPLLTLKPITGQA